MTDDEPTDPIALARLFVSGRTLRRATMVQVVQDLLSIIEANQDMPPAKVIPDTPCGIPNVIGYDRKPPITIDATSSGAVFLGPEANRYFTRTEAIALAGGIARAATTAKPVTKG